MCYNVINNSNDYSGELNIMTQKLDYSREDAMEILNNNNYTDEEKRTKYDEYMNTLKKARKNQIVEILNNSARQIPTITKDIYISKLKEYESDDLSIPFEVIEKKLSDFDNEMRKKYEEYLNSQNTSEEIIEPDVSKDDDLELTNFDDTIFKAPVVDDFIEEDDEEELKPSFSFTGEMSVLNEDSETVDKPIFDGEDDEEVMPNMNEAEAGNASAIIISIIAVIIGAVVMYSIIRLN